MNRRSLYVASISHSEWNKWFLSSAIILTAIAAPVAADQCCRCRPTLLTWDGCPADPLPSPSARPLVGDRPDFTEASSVVGLGVMQLEAGYTYTRDDSLTPTESHTAPEALLRIGMVAEWFELRLGYTSAREQDGGITNSGGEDMFVGMKIAVTQQDCWLPEVAFLGELQIPTGSAGLTADQVLPRGGLIYGWELNNCWSTAGQTIFAEALDDRTANSYFEVSQSWTVGVSLTDNVGAYAEWFSIIPHDADTNQTESFFDGGLTFLLTPNLQWDVRGGVGLNGAADDYFVGSGFVLRR
ncbi:MAG: transporter [Aeoliella sp.]